MCQISRSFSTCIRFRWHFPFFYMSISRCGNQILHFWMNIPGNNWTMRSYNAEKCELILFSNLSGCSVFSPFCFGTSSIKDDTLDSIGVCCIMVWDSFFVAKSLYMRWIQWNLCVIIIYRVSVERKEDETKMVWLMAKAWEWCSRSVHSFQLTFLSIIHFSFYYYDCLFAQNIVIVITSRTTLLHSICHPSKCTYVSLCVVPFHSIRFGRTFARAPTSTRYIYIYMCVCEHNIICVCVRLCQSTRNQQSVIKAMAHNHAPALRALVSSYFRWFCTIFFDCSVVDWLFMAIYCWWRFRNSSRKVCVFCVNGGSFYWPHSGSTSKYSTMWSIDTRCLQFH